MFDTLRDEVDQLHIPVDGDAISELFAIRDRLDAKLSEVVGEFDAAGLQTDQRVGAQRPADAV